MSEAELKKVFHDYVKGAAGGKTLSAADLEWANDKAISKMVKECIPQCKTTSEASVFPKLMNKTTKKLSCDAFVKEYFPNLAKIAVETKTKEKNLPLDDPRVVEESGKLIAAVLKKASAPKAEGGKSAAVVDRLTDTSKYTGAHKERFDESGKGKGASGRKDEVKNTGYVGNYKGEGTYEKK